MRTGMLAKNLGPGPHRSQPQVGQTIQKGKSQLERGRKDGVCFFFQGEYWPRVSQATGDMLDSPFLDQRKNRCYSSSR